MKNYTHYFKNMDEVFKFFSPDRNHVYGPITKVFDGRQAICNGTISKLDFFNILATAIEFAKGVNSREEASDVLDVIKDVVLDIKYDGFTNKIGEQGDELMYLVSAIKFEVCRMKPEYTDIWSRLGNLCRNVNQKKYFDRYNQLAEESYQNYQSLNRRIKNDL